LRSWPNRLREVCEPIFRAVAILQPTSISVVRPEFAGAWQVAASPAPRESPVLRSRAARHSA